MDSDEPYFLVRHSDSNFLVVDAAINLMQSLQTKLLQNLRPKIVDLKLEYVKVIVIEQATFRASVPQRNILRERSCPIVTNTLTSMLYGGL